MEPEMRSDLTDSDDDSMPSPPKAAGAVTFKEVKANPKVRRLIEGANDLLKAMGYTEHGHRHVTVVAGITGYVLENLGVSQREIELGQIAAYLHDIGNVVNRVDHPMIGATIAFQILNEMGMDAVEIAPILGAIGNHEELMGLPVSVMSAALIIADKSDVHFSRVQNPILETFDIHDRVNYAVQKSRVTLIRENQTIDLALEIDTSYATVMEYFEIFLTRMVMCRRSADTLGYKFLLNVNGVRLE
jgi:metal-dependent HD superfamily phosphatase/phosphodiesterase